MTNIPHDPETFKVVVLNLEFQRPELAKSLANLRKTVADTLYGHLFEPQFWMNLAVSFEYPEIVPAGVELLESYGFEFLEGMQAQAEYYLTNLPKTCNSYPMVEDFHSSVTAYLAKYSGQFIPERPKNFNQLIKNEQ